MNGFRLAAACLLPLWLGACAVARPPAAVEATPAPQWTAPLPHGGRLADLADWWRRFDDPALARLIDAAQAESPSLAAARSRIEQARAARVAAGAALRPSVDGVASLGRGNTQPPLPALTTLQAGADAGWEIDLFGGRRSDALAAEARFRGAQAGWHEARVSVAAETAANYFRLRSCQRQLEVAGNDARSRAETARLAQLSAEAGFTAPASAALAQASSADSAARLVQQRAQCEVEITTLAALTGIASPALREQLAPAATPLPDALFAIDALPANVLAQRPDVYQAEQALAAASAEVGSARAAQLPRVTLSGSIRAGYVRMAGETQDAQTWSFGPLAVNLPLFDSGRRAANTEAAMARYDEAAAAYRGRVRQAVSEVEQALIALDSVRARGDSARIAARGFNQFFEATEARYRSGLASQVELEDARRDLLAAQTALVGLERELQAAWVALYRAAGGGWQPETPVPASASR